jgi:hypothetical protein
MLSQRDRGRIAMRPIMFALLIAVPFPVFAQNAGMQEIIVTAQRRQSDDYDEHVPAVGLHRVADYAVQEVVIAGDTRDAEKRRNEIFAMAKAALDLAAKRGNIELATGEMVVEPLTLANYRNLPLKNDGRPDTDKTRFLVKTKLSQGGDAKAALDRITSFIKDVPPAGRAEMKAVDDLTLSVVQPDSYRGAIIDLVAADARATATRMGSDYAIEADGLDRPVEWTRAGLTEVFLYVPYRYKVIPKK